MIQINHQTKDAKNKSERFTVLNALKTNPTKSNSEKIMPVTLQIKKLFFLPKIFDKDAERTLPPSNGKTGKKLIIASEKLASATMSV